ncbi:structure-specific endonuclease subunit slx1 [Aplysia californica]|uniref:Structure-specific endonuclease subunit SLX1 homolog n=1 Tax=Aplysia californica TaxID=6500 RepID=A0ABM1VUY8_APLCA|nr:structure-specific endonuclease subunit slx1 [Aplysia californica]
MVQEVENFYGVYLLYCMNPKYQGRTYIGYTVNPNRRIKQHNTGAHAGGAYRTSGRGPWEMILIIHGFPNDVSGLRFEWAWQHPDKSRRLKGVTGKSRKETQYEFRWRVVCNMLRTAPWSGLSLTVRWLKQDFYREFPSGLQPPLHMPVKYGPVVSKKVSKDAKKKHGGTSTSEASDNDRPGNEDGPLDLSIEAMNTCSICDLLIQAEDKSVTCLKPRCSMMSHLVCLAKSFLPDPTKLLPVEGKCPQCNVTLLWGEVIRHMKGCHSNLSESTLQGDTTVAEMV